MNKHYFLLILFFLLFFRFNSVIEEDNEYSQNLNLWKSHKIHHYSFHREDSGFLPKTPRNVIVTNNKITSIFLSNDSIFVHDTLFYKYRTIDDLYTE